jgi:hypothetical protein
MDVSGMAVAGVDTFQKPILFSGQQRLSVIKTGIEEIRGS